MAQEWQAKHYSKIIRLHFSWWIASSRLSFIYLSWPACKQGMHKMPRPSVPSVQPPPAETVYHDAIFSSSFFYLLGQWYIQRKSVPWKKKFWSCFPLQACGAYACVDSGEECGAWLGGSTSKKYIINISLELSFDQLLLLSSKTAGNH